MTHLVLPASLGFSFATLPFPPCVPVGFLCFWNILCLFLPHALCICYSLGLECSSQLFPIHHLGTNSNDTSWELIFRSPNLICVPFLTLKLLYIVILFYFLQGSWHYLNLLIVPLVYYLIKVGTLTCSLLYLQHLEQYMWEIFNNHLLTDKWMKNEYIFQVNIWRDHYPGIRDRIIWRVKIFSRSISSLQ